MILNKGQLIGLPVRTASGQDLGEINDIELDSEFQSIVNYMVKSKRLIKELFSDKLDHLMVNRTQIVSLDDKEMVVEDNVLKTAEEEGERKAVLEKEAGAVISEMKS